MASAALQSRPQSLVWRLAALALVVGGLAITAFLLADQLEAFRDALRRTSIIGLATGFVLTLAGSWAGYRAFGAAFDRDHEKRLAPHRLASLYFSAQLLRHLPGRFLGIVYQIAATRDEVPTRAWIAANVLQSLAIAATGVLIGLIIVLSPGWHTATIALLSTAAVTRWITLRSRLPARFTTRLARSRSAALRAIAEPLLAMLAGDRKALSACIGWASLSWIIYLAAWGCYGAAFPDLGVWDGVRLSAYYAIAWFVGFASLIAPSGWGVREVTFLAMARQFPDEALAYGLVIGRISLLLNDLVLGGSALVAARWMQKSASGGQN